METDMGSGTDGLMKPPRKFKGFEVEIAESGFCPPDLRLPKAERRLH